MYKSLFLMFSALALFSSCKKDALNNPNQIVITQLTNDEYSGNYSKTIMNGSFNLWVQGTVSLNSQGLVNYNNYLSLRGYFYNIPDTVTTGGAVTIDTIHLLQNSTYSAEEQNIDSGFFGRNISFNITPPINQTPQFTASVYLPKVMYAQLGSLTSNIANPTGDTLFWNADLNDMDGILIDANYIPTQYINNGISTKYPNAIEKLINAVPDNGSYILPNSFWAAFPSGAYIQIGLSRQHYCLVTYNQYKYLIQTYSNTFIIDAKVP